MLITQNMARKILGRKLVLMIDPSMVHYHIGGIRPLTKSLEHSLSRRLPGPLACFLLGKKGRRLGRLHPFILKASHFPEPEPVFGMEKYKKIRDFLGHRNDYTKSFWYKTLVDCLAREGQVRHKKILMKTLKDIDAFFQNYVLKMVQSLEKSGYDPEKGSQIGRAMIGASGEIYIANQAGHRFFISREVGVKRFPLVIKCVHEEWVKSWGLSRLIPDKKKWSEALADVEMMHI